MSQSHVLLPAYILALKDGYWSVVHLSNPSSVFQQDTATENKCGKGGAFQMVRRTLKRLMQWSHECQ